MNANSKKVLIILLILMLAMSLTLFADKTEKTKDKPKGANVFTDKDPDDVAEEIQKNIYTSLAGPVITIGGIATFIAISICGLEIIGSRNNPEKRGGAMSNIMWIGGGLLVLGMAGVITGFFLTIANKT